MNDNFSHNRVNLASAKFGAEVIYATDDFFADKSRLISDTDPVFIDGKYDDNGKWMDGWESRRKRVAGYDHCIVKLAFPGCIYGVVVDTSHFTGNFPPFCSLDACSCPEGDPDDTTEWTKVLEKTGLEGNSLFRSRIPNDDIFTHVRLNIYPDGGIARLKVFGKVHCNWDLHDPRESCNLLSLENGGRAIAWNDAHFGHPVNMLGQGRGVNMGDGWETRRRREPGNDWCVLQLGHAGSIERIELDTAHFKGNYPDRFSIQATCNYEWSESDLVAQSSEWPFLIPEQKLSADGIHEFIDAIAQHEAISHIRLNIFPDGGISRLRLFGKIFKA
ncbi:MAG: allantoicase [Verrucomicrobia bacterium]|nr:allantoicase [Verrucomicrobiota bacterium]MDA1068275.1 allantoicase [Verrucomicrobiota bacterium]